MASQLFYRGCITSVFTCALIACSSSDGGGAADTNGGDGEVLPQPGYTAGVLALAVSNGFTLEQIGTVGGARQLVALPNGDLLIGTSGKTIALITAAEGSSASPVTFATTTESAAQGITYSAETGSVYVSTEHHVYAIPYSDGATSGTPGPAIASFRQGGISGTDGDVHHTSSIALADGKLYVGIGSSCNACTESDPTRATIQVMDTDGSNMATRATRFRNAIALAANPATGTLWAGGAGQDHVLSSLGHPYEFFDAVTKHEGVADYGWPECEENHNAFGSGADCSGTVAPAIEFPAYSTLIGAAFYPLEQTGAHVFPEAYRGGVFITTHGSWHQESDGKYYSAPRVAFVPVKDDAAALPVNWDDPTTQWTDFIGNFQHDDGKTRVARPTGIAVGPEGSLFFAEDDNGKIFRVRPN